MNYRFSARALAAKAPEAGGFSVPAALCFPQEEFSALSAQVLEENPIAALQYSISEGYGPFRESAMAFACRRWPLCQGDDQLLVTSGASQAIDFAIKCFCDKGDAVLFATPLSRQQEALLAAYQVTPVPVADRAKHPESRVLLAAPHRVDMPLEARRQLVDLAHTHNLLIIEDGAGGDPTGEALPPLKALDKDGRVIFCGSFSAVLSPALRLGYAIAPAAVIAKLTVAKQCSDVHTTVWSQMVCDRFLRQGKMEPHLERLRAQATL